MGSRHPIVSLVMNVTFRYRYEHDAPRREPEAGLACDAEDIRRAGKRALS